MGRDGHMAKRDELFEFAQKHNIKFITVAELIAYRLKNEKIVTREAEAHLPTQFGEFEIYGYVNHLTGQESVALVKDDGSDKIPLIRVHSECLTEIFSTVLNATATISFTVPLNSLTTTAKAPLSI